MNRLRLFSAESDVRALERELRFLDEAVDFTAASARLEELSAALSQESAWTSPNVAMKMTREHARLSHRVGEVAELRAAAKDAIELRELALGERDEQVRDEAEAKIRELLSTLSSTRARMLLCGPWDGHDCFLEVQAGAGGDDACDWASMLLRMYSMWASHRGWTVQSVSQTPGGVAGLRSGVVRIVGDAYGWAKAEAGVHRLSRRHTSFAKVLVLPELGTRHTSLLLGVLLRFHRMARPDSEATESRIPDADLRVDTFRAQGAGGQHVNTTDSAVRAVHMPTGLSAVCQSQRSQHANRQAAVALLTAKVAALEQERRDASMNELVTALGENTWGNQIRSYVLHPYQSVKDHRTAVESSDVAGMFDGRLSILDAFVEKGVEFLYQQRMHPDAPHHPRPQR